MRDDLSHRPLPLGEGERQPPVERGGDPVLDGRARHRGHRRGGVPPLGERGLHGERLVPLEPLARLPQVLAVRRPVDRPDGQLPWPQVMLRAHLGGQRVLTGVQGLEHGVDVPGDRPRGQLGARRVDRDQLLGELLGELRGQPLVGGGDREQLVLGVHQLAAAAEARHRAGEQGERALLQLLRVEPDAGEERELQLARAVGDDDLKPLLVRPPAGGRLRPLAGNVPPDHAGHGHPGEHGDVVALAAGSRAGSARPWCNSGGGSGAAGHRPSAGRRPSRTCRSPSCPAPGPKDRAAWSRGPA